MTDHYTDDSAMQHTGQNQVSGVQMHADRQVLVVEGCVCVYVCVYGLVRLRV
jgi:hypothetical protein